MIKYDRNRFITDEEAAKVIKLFNEGYSQNDILAHVPRISYIYLPSILVRLGQLNSYRFNSKKRR